MALFMDFENLAIGIEEAKYGKFDLDLIQRRLVEKGKILFKRAYANWDRYGKYRRDFHDASIELFDIPKSTRSGKNAADIQMVVDAMELCYSKEHIDVFVLASGDSDFSPLVSKLRENDKYVIGFGVKNSVSQLLVSNCDEFIYYDDLVRDSETKIKAKRKRTTTAKPRTKAEHKGKGANADALKQEGIDLVMATVEDLFKERGEEEKVWGSMVKQTLKRRQPGFSEGYHGFRSFSQMLIEAQSRGLLKLELDEKSGGYIIKSFSQDE